MTKNEAEFAGQQVCTQLKALTQNYNRNHFQVKTDDATSRRIREFCEKNGLAHSQFLNVLITNFFKTNG